MSAREQSLADLLSGMAPAPRDLAVTDVTLDSRAAKAGALFLACRGRTHHGLDFASQAVANGARAVVYEPAGPVSKSRPPEFPSDIFVAAIPDLGARAGEIADRFFGSPSLHLTIAGITGTNGKTTCAYLLSQALESCGMPAAYSGTLGFGRAGKLEASTHTTADAVEVHRQLARLRELGAECVAMEVSSHALDQRRVSDVRFNTAAFTNLTRDHLDYHGTMERYGSAKARLFSAPRLAARVVNVDDRFGAQLAREPDAGRLVVTTRSARPFAEILGASRRESSIAPAYVRAAAARPGPRGLDIGIESSWGSTQVSAPLIGDFNVDNLLTVLAVLLAWDIPLARAANALASVSAPPGRMEAFGGGDGRTLALVDYAHTPDALAKALRAARAHCRGKLRVVFGCGGDRDPGKRAEMGRIAAELADELIVTDDNPRGEDPRRIVEQIVAGVGSSAAMQVEHDRQRAIALAVHASLPGDVVLVAGKGHEDHQIYGTERRVFSDRDTVREVLEEAGR